MTCLVKRIFFSGDTTEVEMLLLMCGPHLLTYLPPPPSSMFCLITTFFHDDLPCFVFPPPVGILSLGPVSINQTWLFDSI